MLATLAAVADRATLERALARDVPSRDARRLEKAALMVIPDLDPQEQVMKVAAGTWLSGNRCLLVATSRRILASDGERLDVMPYNRMLAVDYRESWRKGRIMIRVHGTSADVRDIHLETARELKQIIDTAKRSSSTPGVTTPPH
jgi:hypothetical protein